MNNRLLWGLAAGLAIVILGGRRLLSEPLAGKASAPAAPLSWNLEQFGDSTLLGNSILLGKRDPKHPLKLVLVPMRAGPAGLLLRVEVWNLSDKPQLVEPIGPHRYYPEFRDAAGHEIVGSLLHPANIMTLTINEFSRISPYNCLASNYLFPTFYERTKGSHGIACRIRVHHSYVIDSKAGRYGAFELTSEWVNVPPL